MNNNLFYNYIVDYIDRNGKDYYNIFQIPSFCVTNEQNGARQIKAMLINQGHTPKIIVCAKGDYSMDELKLLAEGRLYSKQTLIEGLKNAPIECV